ncbi:class I SAM-dependent methyltransferase [bacterium]|nr:class I SAM-dependent methyltransferase [bacterium]
MKSVDESIAAAMDCGSTELVPYLPYILQDFQELGSSADSIVSIIQKHNTRHHIDVLDLGCGKGAVACAIAETLDARCTGIDAVGEFIDYANGIAGKKGLQNCVFITGDIRDRNAVDGRYDFIVLGSIGPVYGNYRETLDFLKPWLKRDGMVILDDGCKKNDTDHGAENAKEIIAREIAEAGMKIVAEYRGDEVCNAREFDEQLAAIRKRCNELKIIYPDKALLFSGYIEQQENEYASLKNDVICFTLVLARKT